MLGTHWGPKNHSFLRLWGSLGGSRGVLGCLGGGFGRPGAVLKASWPHLGGAWPLFEGLLGPLRGILAPSWEHLGAMLGHLGVLGRVLRVSQKRLRPLFGYVGGVCSRRFVFSLFLDMLLYVFISV